MVDEGRKQYHNIQSGPLESLLPNTFIVTQTLSRVIQWTFGTLSAVHYLCPSLHVRLTSAYLRSQPG